MVSQVKIRLLNNTIIIILDCGKASTRAMEKTIKVLKEEGHELIEFDTSVFGNYNCLYVALLLSAGLVKLLIFMVIV